MKTHRRKKSSGFFICIMRWSTLVGQELCKSSMRKHAVGPIPTQRTMARSSTFARILPFQGGEERAALSRATKSSRPIRPRYLSRYVLSVENPGRHRNGSPIMAL